MGWSLLLCLSVAWLLHLTHNLISSPPLPSNLIGWRLLNLSQDVTKTQLEKKTTQRLNLQKGDRPIYHATFYRFSRKRFAVPWSVWTPRVKSFWFGERRSNFGPAAICTLAFLFWQPWKDRRSAKEDLCVLAQAKCSPFFLEILSIYKKRISLQVLRGPITEEHIWYWIPSWASHNNPPARHPTPQPS